jgi:hypothetical protein
MIRQFVMIIAFPDKMNPGDVSSVEKFVPML